MSRPNISKYRPVLTHEQITHILALCKRDMSPISIRCISVLAPFEHKIQNHSVKAAHKVDVNTLEDSLGFSVITESSSVDMDTLYQIWKNDSSKLSLDQLETLMAYRYSNDLMSTEEETQYENSLISPIQKA